MVKWQYDERGTNIFDLEIESVRVRDDDYDGKSVARFFATVQGDDDDYVTTDMIMDIPLSIIPYCDDEIDVWTHYMHKTYGDVIKDILSQFKQYI